MLSKEQLENISSSLVQVTGSNRPFRGIAIILFGDVGQLLPIDSRVPKCWKSVLFKEAYKYTLKESMRQHGDLELQNVLNKIRLGDVCNDKDVVQFIKKRIRAPPSNAVRLYVTRDLARYANKAGLSNVEGEFTAIDSDDYPEVDRAGETCLNRETKLMKRLFVKLGATVMLTHNLGVTKSWPNGALARLVSIHDDVLELGHCDNGNKKFVQKVQDYFPGTIYSRKQFPVTLAYASTIHKVQSLNMFYLRGGRVYIYLEFP